MPTYIKDPTPSWLKPEQASVTDSARTKVLRWIASVIGADDPTSQVMGLMTTAVPSAGKEGGILGAAKKWIKAYHGSPHDFEQFDLSKIGTGEGAQAYGHGLYFAESEGVAKSYRDTLSKGTARIPHEPGTGATPQTWSYLTKRHEGVAAGGGWLHGEDPLSLAKREWSITNGNKDEAIKALRSQALDAKRFAEVWAGQKPDAEIQRALAVSRDAEVAAIALRDNIVDLTIPPGRMYEVAIHADPDHMLDWDAGGRQQYVAAAEAKNRAAGRFPASPEGEREAIAEFVKQGTPGIKYLDQGSRAAGEGSRNYVVFDDAIVTILKKYGLLPAAATAGVYQKYQDAEQ